MAENQKIQQIDCTKVPEPTLRRLPWYLSNVKLLKQRGERFVSSTQISKELNIDTLVGTNLNGIPIYHSDDFLKKMEEYDVQIGVLTVPIEIAQCITDMMVDGGIKAVWNFTPFRIRVPEDIVVQNTSLYAHLAVMFNRLNFNEIK